LLESGAEEDDAFDAALIHELEQQEAALFSDSLDSDSVSEDGNQSFIWSDDWADDGGSEELQPATISAAGNIRKSELGDAEDDTRPVLSQSIEDFDRAAARAAQIFYAPVKDGARIHFSSTTGNEILPRAPPFSDAMPRAPPVSGVNNPNNQYLITDAIVVGDPLMPSIDGAQLEPVLLAALAEWAEYAAASGQTGLLENIRVEIADLPGNVLAEADGETIFVDINAAGH
jgi:hypothetical protein